MADSSDNTIDVNIWNDARTKAVTVTTDGSKERLDVSTKIEGGSFQVQEFNPVVDVNVAGISLSTGSWSTILSIPSAQGKLDFIGVSGSSSNYRVRLTMDSIQIFDLSMSDINTLGLSNDVGVPIRAEIALKNFRYRPYEGVDFSSSVLIEAQATSGSVTIYTIVTHREVP